MTTYIELQGGEYVNADMVTRISTYLGQGPSYVLIATPDLPLNRFQEGQYGTATPREIADELLAVLGHPTLSGRTRVISMEQGKITTRYLDAAEPSVH